MSTIKSSSEHLTLNADGASKDLKLQTNGTERAIVKADGKVGIGTSSPTSQLSLKEVTSNTTTRSDQLRIQAESTGTTGVGFGSNIYFVGERAGGTLQAMGRIGFGASTNTTSNLSSDFIVQTADSGVSSEKFRIDSDGTHHILMDGANNALRVFYAQGWIAGNASMDIDVPLHNDGGTGTYLHVEAAMTHHPSYDCALETWVSRRSTNQRSDEQFRRNTTNSGNWSVTSPNTTTLRITKNAGSYSGSGPWWIRVTFRTA